ncbi:MAG TPA: PDZ domain-containing protein, partial [Chitinophagaceae bacterium]|nr:PDZ domain-containing protein [Chitinophagaceae bacterium]
EDPDELSEVIQKHKPGEKVTVTYLRDNKEEKATAELSKWKGVNSFTMPKIDMGNMDFGQAMPKVPSSPRLQGPYGNLFSVKNGQPKLGLSVQDTDDGKGVKVIEVDDESTALKAGVKKDDLILEVDGKAVNSTDDISKIIKESKDKNSIMLKLTRAGKTQNIEVKMPKKIKTTDI